MGKAVCLLTPDIVPIATTRLPQARYSIGSKRSKSAVRAMFSKNLPTVALPL
jgi:hypothetical protein